MYKKQLIVGWLKNNKRLIIIWATIGSFIFILLFPPKFIVIPNNYGGLVIIDNCWIFDLDYWESSFPPTIDWGRTFTYILAITLLGSLLIYTLRDKDKWK